MTQKFYYCPEGFSLQKTEAGWRWRETDAERWSKLYKNRWDALAAIDAEFGTIVLGALKGSQE